jgi:hypothetical protein
MCWILSTSLFVGLGRKESGRCVVKRVVIETREVSPDDCVTRAASHNKADCGFSNCKEGRHRPRTVKWWFVMLGDDERGL